MGLISDIRQNIRYEFINVRDFICYLAYIQNESVEDIVSWLYYNKFDKDAISYDIDQHNRVSTGNRDNGIDVNIDDLFEQISINGIKTIILIKKNYKALKKKKMNTIWRVMKLLAATFTSRSNSCSH